jgi:hypothetical protein
MNEVTTPVAAPARKVLRCGHEHTLAHYIVATVMFSTIMGLKVGIPASELKADAVEFLNEIFNELGIDNYRLPEEINNLPAEAFVEVPVN